MSRRKENLQDYQNDWAKNIVGDAIHISNATSGLQGYYCLGCDKEMQAVKFKNPLFNSYFRHNASNVDKDNAECTFSSRVYRERLAEQILLRLKRLKLPDVYKFPPKGIDGNPILLVPKTEVEAYSAKAQLTFYEDEEGTVRWGKNPEIDERYLLVRPDVTFFDKDEKPILFVEFVITHKLSEEKKAALRRLGINTVQIIVPKASEEEIEKSLKSVTKVKWVYNEDEANTEYLSIQQGDTERVSFIDDEQRKLFEESYACRAAQVSNLIRSITRSLASQPYRGTERHFEQEISRVEKATARNRTRLEELESAYEREAYSEIEPEEIEIDKGLIDIERQQRKSEEESIHLEERYLKKREGLEREEELLRRVITEHNDKGTVGESMGAVYAARQESLQRDIERIRNNIKGILEEEGIFRRNIEQLKMAELERFEWDKKQESASFRQRKGVLERARIDIESKIRSFAESEEGMGGGMESEFETVRDTTIKKISSRDTSGNTELSQRIKAVLAIGGFLSSYDDRTDTYKRYKSYLEFVRRGTWKKW